MTDEQIRAAVKLMRKVLEEKQSSTIAKSDLLYMPQKNIDQRFIADKEG